jgi:hypothetical protein
VYSLGPIQDHLAALAFTSIDLAISPSSLVAMDLSDMFCDLKGATLSPRLLQASQSPSLLL